MPKSLDLYEDTERLGAPLFEYPEGLQPEKATQLAVVPCDVQHARILTERWHSRLPLTQSGPWMYAFRAAFDGMTYGVALVHNPSARTLPRDWLELRRLTVAPDAPPHTASRMLGQIRRWLQRNTKASRLISYQDPSVHKGTIYRAAGWTIGYVASDRARDRTKPRTGTGRAYRTNQNSDEVDRVGKIRWEVPL